MFLREFQLIYCICYYSVHNELYKVVYIYLAKQNRKMFNIFEKLQ